MRCLRLLGLFLITVGCGSTVRAEELDVEGFRRVVRKEVDVFLVSLPSERQLIVSKAVGQRLLVGSVDELRTILATVRYRRTETSVTTEPFHNVLRRQIDRTFRTSRFHYRRISGCQPASRGGRGRVVPRSAAVGLGQVA